MSLVGTRPPTVDEWDKYELHHRARLATKPGLTGMWQVSGRSNITDFEEVVKLDKQYISEWTMGLDIKILFKTVQVVFKKEGSIEILMQTAFFSREPGSRQQIDLNLFGTWGQTAIAHAYFIENIIMFIPFGLLAPMVFERMRKVRFCVFIGFLCSCGIELSQLITQRGYCQLDDVVTNTVGMLVGWGIWKMLSSVGIAGNPLF